MTISKLEIDNAYRLLEELANGTQYFSSSWSLKKLAQLRELMRDPNFSDILEEVERKERSVINKELVPELQDRLTVFFNKFPKVTKFVIKGYTPGFMDGDRCEHSTSIEVSDNKPKGVIAEFRDNEAERWLDNNMDILLSIYGTDWEFTAFNNNGNIAFHKESYDCGY